MNSLFDATRRSVIPQKTAAHFVVIAVLLGALGAVISNQLNDDFSEDQPLPNTILMTINDVPLSVAEYDKGLELIATDKITPVNDRDRQLAFIRMLEEELLVQDALVLDLVRQDENLRRATLAQMLEIALGSSTVSGEGKVTPERMRRFEEYMEMLRGRAKIKHFSDIEDPS